MRLVTWNVESLRDDGTDRARWLGERVAALGADVLAVQEIGGEEAFAALGEASGLSHGHLSGEPDERGMRVGLLSRAPLTRVRDVTADPSWLAATSQGTLPGTGPWHLPEGRLRRGGVAGELTLPDGSTLLVASVHLKSASLQGARRDVDRALDRREWLAARVHSIQQRVAEAAAVRAWIDGAISGEGAPAHAALLGDLNDIAFSEVLTLLAGPPGRDAVTDAARLYPTWRAGGPSRAIDHILLTRDLRLRCTAADALPVPWRAPPGPAELAAPAVWPDHSPVWVDITI